MSCEASNGPATLFHLGIVEERRPGLVAHQRALPLLVEAHEDVGGDMGVDCLHAEAAGDRIVDLVPAEPAIRGDVKIVVEGARVAEEANEGNRDIRGPREGP